MKADILSLKMYAGIQERSEGFHQLLAKWFPFAIYYPVEDETVDVYAVLDCRRDSKWIVKRLDLPQSDS